MRKNFVFINKLKKNRFLKTIYIRISGLKQTSFLIRFHGCLNLLLKYNHIGKRYLSGKHGIELGGPSSIFNDNGVFPIYAFVDKLDNCDFSTQTPWLEKIEKGKTYFYHRKKPKGNQIICDGANLDSVESGKYEFLLASHVIEHIANPIKAMSEWLRILKSNGIIVLVVPHKEKTYDRKRTVTTIEHLVEDFEKDIGEDDLTHIEEVIEKCDFALHPPVESLEAFKEKALNNFKHRYIHHHTFDTELAVKLCTQVGMQIISVKTALPYHIIIVGRKSSIAQTDLNKDFISKNARYKNKSCFSSDRYV